MADVKSRKPSNTAFKQQRLRAWQPLLVPKTVLPTLFLAGIIFAPIGGIFLYKSDTVNQIIIDYTDCVSAVGPDLTPIPSSLYSYMFSQDNTTVIREPSYIANSYSSYLDGSPVLTGGNVTRCTIEFTLPFDLQAPVYLYYHMTNFYQNHRKYVKSLSYNQLNGDAISAYDANQSCSPVGVDPNGKIYYPCGLIANSIFNDTFSNLTLLNAPGTKNDSIVYTMDETGISWPSDKSKFKKTSMSSADVVPPPNWIARYPGGVYNDSNLFDPSQDEHFQVWMRTSWYPTFRKLYSHYSNNDAPMNAGTYQVEVDMNYNITSFGGRKALVITGTSFLGNRNGFMGYSYIIMGCLCAFFGIVLLAWHCIKPRKLGDHDRLSWNNE